MKINKKTKIALLLLSPSIIGLVCVLIYNLVTNFIPTLIFLLITFIVITLSLGIMFLIESTIIE